MGAINYFTSDYITLGIKPYDDRDILNDPDAMEGIAENMKNYNITLDEALAEEINYYYEADFDNITTELEKHNFYYYHITIKPGYYEGFTLNIENNFPVFFEDWHEKRDAQKEITEIKQLLIECAGLGMVECTPGWCTGYNDYRGTIESIQAAINEMRREARATPTYSKYKNNY